MTSRKSILGQGVACFLLWAAGMLPVSAAPELPGLPWEDPAPELWFPVGEEIDYEVYWGVFMVGEATAKAEWINRDGRRLLSLSMKAQSNGLVEKLYPVKEVLQTILDPATFLPLSFEKDSHEGRHHTHELTTFDHAAKKGRWKSLLKDKQKEFDIEADTRDLMGLMYWIRKDRILAGETRNYRVMTDEKLYELVVEAGKAEKVSLKNYGKVPCIKMEPKGKFNGMFVRKGRMFLWISDDERYTICRATASVPVASIKIMLKKVRGPGGDFWTREAKSE
ncbi:MAG TPA: hypothetical protein DCM68_08840 [Verrucomicrobia bacterium]|nr:hypothetical protein [Verrucomicrobiota bacterium]